jgi:uncharacterized protein (DUF4415 family)
MSKKPTIKLSLDPNNLPKLTKKQIAMLDALEKLPDSEIDCSDIPEHKFMYKPVKQVTTIRLDSDVLAWLRTYGKGYQSRINAILRKEMLTATKVE